MALLGIYQAARIVVLGILGILLMSSTLDCWSAHRSPTGQNDNGASLGSSLLALAYTAALVAAAATVVSWLDRIVGA